jgi:hypothetical protein
MFDFFFKRESADDKQDGANYADDLDMVISPKDGTLVPVAVVNGVHVCWHCFEQFVEDVAHPHRAVEYNAGGFGTRILLHSSCVSRVKVYQGDIVKDKIAGHQRRRFLTRALKPFTKKDAVEKTE